VKSTSTQQEKSPLKGPSSNPNANPNPSPNPLPTPMKADTDADSLIDPVDPNSTRVDPLHFLIRAGTCTLILALKDRFWGQKFQNSLHEGGSHFIFTKYQLQTWVGG